MTLLVGMVHSQGWAPMKWLRSRHTYCSRALDILIPSQKKGNAYETRVCFKLRAAMFGPTLTVFQSLTKHLVSDFQRFEQVLRPHRAQF
jgi:hypothetical protein